MLCYIRLNKQFELVVRNGEEFVIDKLSGKKLLKQSDCALVLKQCHDQKQHCGRQTTIQHIKAEFVYIPENIVVDYLKKCNICASRTALPKPVTGKAIYAKGVMHHVEVDLIDMSSRPDGESKYIIHMQDHTSKYCWAKPLSSKHCSGVTRFIRNVFYTFGPPCILQSDNGGEFVGRELREMLQAEFPNVQHRFITPRHPESDGLIERHNQVLEQRIGSWLQENRRDDGWATALPSIIFNINTSYTRTIKSTPFQFMFLRSHVQVLSTQHTMSNNEGMTADSCS